MTDTTTPASTAAEIAELRAELAEIEAAAAAPTEAEIAEAIDKANAAAVDAGQPLVVAGLVRATLPRPTTGRGQNVPVGSDGRHRTPAQLAEMVPADKRADFLANLAGLVAGLRRGH
ncbi:MAG TPA: hypothetical protein VHW66_21865 [Stellaceae bacterium]|jgi:hypothetical protein|nr:hypothetical protein [Stellaceae bacterium]